MKTVLQILYSALIYPLIIFLFHIAALFKTNIRKALAGRYQFKKEILKGINGKRKNRNLVLLHASSMGEFEHVKPLITKLNTEYNVKTVVTFFSPSGFENVKEFPGVLFFLYLPFDFQFIWNRVYKLLRPKMLIISKHDVWPNQVWNAEKHAIPSYLINASLSAGSSRINPFVRFFQEYIYRSLTRIYTISEEDSRRFKNKFPHSAIEVTGDTKFDQVLLRREQAKEKEILPQNWLKDNIILLFGSIWPEDLKHIYPAIWQLLAGKEKAKIILVPHQPETALIQTIIGKTGREQTGLFSEPLSAKSRVLIVDKVGVLADLYKYAHVAYVGGSFRQGIHNVMEPAVYEIPVLYGPAHKNSFEAILLHREEGSIVVNNAKELTEALNQLLK